MEIGDREVNVTIITMPVAKEQFNPHDTPHDKSLYYSAGRAAIQTWSLATEAGYRHLGLSVV